MTTLKARRTRERVIIALAVPTLVIVIFLTVWQLAVVNPQSAQTHDALCAQRTNLQQQVTTTQKFLKHPQIAPDFNNPRTLALIRSQLPGQQKTLVAFSVLSCG